MLPTAVALALPNADFVAVRDGLLAAGYEPLPAENAEDLEALLDSRDDIRVAIVNGEADIDQTLEMYGVLHDCGRKIPALILVQPLTLGRMSLGGRSDCTDEYFSRPFTAQSLRWRIEAILIRSGEVPVEAPVVVEEIVAAYATAATAPVTAPALLLDESQRGHLVVVFNPKGGVGKTTVSVNLGAALQIRKHLRVLLIDCDAVTGHVGPSLGMPQIRTLAEAWLWDHQNGKEEEAIAQVAVPHSVGLDVLVLAATPFHTEVLVPARVAAAIDASRAFYDFIILDLHPDFGPLNLAIFDLADRIIIPVTPDVPCIRAAVQFREVATALEMRNRVVLVINRANSGIASSKVERAVGIPALAKIRSAGRLFYQASDEGVPAIEKAPGAKAIGDINRLADRLIAELKASERDGLGRQRPGGIAGSLRALLGRVTD